MIKTQENDDLGFEDCQRCGEYGCDGLKNCSQCGEDMRCTDEKCQHCD